MFRYINHRLTITLVVVADEAEDNMVPHINLSSRTVITAVATFKTTDLPEVASLTGAATKVPSEEVTSRIYQLIAKKDSISS